MKQTLLLVLFCSFSLTAFGQTSVGFSDPENIQPLLDYRLPAWGYENLYLDFNLGGSRTTDYEDTDSSTNSRFSGNISPAYTRFRQSESRQSFLNAASRLDYTTDSREIGNRRDLQLRLNWSAVEQIYRQNSDLFFTGRSSGSFRQNRVKDDRFTTDELDLDRTFSANLAVGAGFGRLRNVNPIIRSLRLNERLNAVGAASLGMEDLIRASEHFTRENGYQQVYDRPLKYFWEDMDQQISPDLSALDTFDLLYLTNTSNETIGQRLEGWEVTGTAGINYFVNYQREEDRISGTESSQLTQNTNFEPRVTGAWYKNLSLEHQIGFRSNFSYRIPLNRSFDERSHILNISGSWLYNITDRFFSNTALNVLRVGNASETPVYTFIRIQSIFNYFIENSLSLFSSIGYDYRTNSSVTVSNGDVISSTDRGRFQFNAGIRYYLMRGLF